MNWWIVHDASEKRSLWWHWYPGNPTGFSSVTLQTHSSLSGMRGQFSLSALVLVCLPKEVKGHTLRAAQVISRRRCLHHSEDQTWLWLCSLRRNKSKFISFLIRGLDLLYSITHLANNSIYPPVLGVWIRTGSTPPLSSWLTVKPGIIDKILTLMK